MKRYIQKLASALILLQGVFSCYGQIDSVVIHTIDPNEIKEKYVVHSMDSVTTMRAIEQVELQTFVESLEQINDSCPMPVFGTYILDSLTFNYPQVCYHMSASSLDFLERPMDVVKEDGALQILLSRTTFLFRQIEKFKLGLTYFLRNKDKQELPPVIYTPDEITKIYTQGVPSERILKYFNDVAEEANKSFPVLASENIRVDGIFINNGYIEYQYTVFENKEFNIKLVQKNGAAIKSAIIDGMLEEDSDMYMFVTGCSVIDYGINFRYFSYTKKKKYFDVFISSDEVKEIESRRQQY